MPSCQSDTRLRSISHPATTSIAKSWNPTYGVKSSDPKMPAAIGSSGPRLRWRQAAPSVAVRAQNSNREDGQQGGHHQPREKGSDLPRYEQAERHQDGDLRLDRDGSEGNPGPDLPVAPGQPPAGRDRRGHQRNRLADEPAKGGLKEPQPERQLRHPCQPGGAGRHEIPGEKQGAEK